MITDADLDKFADNLTTIAIYAAKRMKLMLIEKELKRIEKRIEALEQYQLGTRLLEDAVGHTI